MTRINLLALLFGLFFAFTGHSVSLAQDAGPVPPDRKVAFHLSVDRPAEDETVALKVKGGPVLAAAPRPEKLEIEVVISGVGGDFETYFDVAKESPVYRSYRANKDDDPARVLEVFKETVREPIVRVVALRQLRYTDHFRDGNFCGRLVFQDPWYPFYEVFVPDSDCNAPQVVPVPREDVEVFQLMKRALENDVPFQQRAVLFQLSGHRD